ncbi:unnamed protein product [Hydatigera taeniaeformis]|uniref:CCHC-type domain-containing protein n=1 Tax=Hydatigena taeniaeformis TaxID=6205 RepID=A0A0R3X180_HYDTA|nr:unnamed protein product [Hydatigera taeniaeformis]
MDSSNQSSRPFRVGCKKCGFSGHLTFQCRNYLRSGETGNIDLDIESTSSDSDDDEMLKEAIAKRKAELAAAKKALKKKQKARSVHPLLFPFPIVQCHPPTYLPF